MWLLATQGIYYLITGLWPIIHIRSFMEVTGPKTDLWLVKTVGAIITAIAITMVSQLGKSEVSDEMIVLAISSAAAFAAIDFYYSLKGTISKVYMIDGVVQIALILFWLLL
jgi:hypothetical protein